MVKFFQILGFSHNFSVPLFFCFNNCLFLVLLGLRHCMRSFSICGERGLLFVAVHQLLIAGASLVVEHGL